MANVRKKHGVDFEAKVALACRVEALIAQRLPHRSRRAAFPHRALVEGRTRLSVRALRPLHPEPVSSPLQDMLIPAQSPEHALLLAFPPTGRLPSTLSAAGLWSVLFEAS
jgi:hypothetical protein